MNDISAYIIPGLKQQYMPKRDVDVKPIDYVNATCKYFGFELEHISKKGRIRKHVYARQVAIYLLAMNTALTLNEMKLFFHDAINDHTTVIHAREFIRGQLSINNERVKNDLKQITELAKISNN